MRLRQSMRFRCPGARKLDQLPAPPGPAFPAGLGHPLALARLASPTSPIGARRSDANPREASGLMKLHLFADAMKLHDVGALRHPGRYPGHKDDLFSIGHELALDQHLCRLVEHVFQA